jgi:hypothetical protein
MVYPKVKTVPLTQDQRILQSSQKLVNSNEVFFTKL